MARGLNKVMLIGNLGQDPDIKTSGGGMVIARLSIATSSSRKDPQSGEWVEETEWHRVVLFGKTAEVAQKYLRKGSKVYVEGRLRTQKWQDEKGVDRWTTEVIGNELQMLDGKDSKGGGQMPVDNYPESQGGGEQQKADDFGDDIPF